MGYRQTDGEGKGAGLRGFSGWRECHLRYFVLALMCQPLQWTVHPDPGPQGSQGRAWKCEEGSKRTEARDELPILMGEHDHYQ